MPLLDADGTPLPPRREIPFVQWLPDGKSTGRSIARDAAVCDRAARFLSSGGRYAYVLRADGLAELVAGFVVQGGEKGEMVVIAEEVVADGPEIGPAVDRLVAASIANLDTLPLSEVVH